MTTKRTEIVEVENLKYEINSKSIIDGISLSVDRGEFVGLIGPNGSGKTTLMRLIDNIISATSGQVRLNRTLLKNLDPKRIAQSVAYMPQDSDIGFDFPVIDLVLFGRYPYQARLKRETQEDMEIARRMLAYVGLGGFDQRLVSELSGGEKQLVFFAKILAQEADLLLLDEPTSNLDIKHQDQIFSMASELTREKKAVIAAVHNLNVAAKYCSRLILLKDGKLVADGSPAAVLRSDILDPVYEVRTSTSINISTGSLSVSVIPRQRGEYGHRIHIIGGAGSAINLTRDLFRSGCQITGGIGHAYDSDEKLWKSLDIVSYTVPAFSKISEGDIEKARRLVEDADLTILCSFPVGTGNVGNLKLAQHARRLVVLEGGVSETQRDFFSNEAQDLFTELERTTPLMTYTELLTKIRSGAIFL